jgi:regulatory protein
MQEIDAPAARALALRWLARREHSRAELEAKLIDKGCEAELARQITARLAAERLVSDARFAESLVRVRRNRGYGPVRIQKELEQKGIEDSAIDAVLDVRSREWTQEIERVRRKRFGAGLPRSYGERARQAKFLQYRGFTFDQIQQVLGSRDSD